MAFAQSLDFQRPSSQLSIDRKPTFFSEDYDTTEEPFMDQSTMISPVTHPEDRRDSFGNATQPVFSPQSEVWNDFSATPVMSERPFASTNPFLDHQSNNPFLRQDNGPFAAHHNPQWPAFDHSQDSRGSIVPATYEAFPEFDQQQAQGFPHAGPFGPMSNNVRPASVFPPAPTPVPMSASPPPGKDWMTMAEQNHPDSRLPKRLRGQSPARYPQNYRSGDGIRKKNARFEIPHERNLSNIDRLIEEAKDDDEAKELKQQKRLLRNRQAALDSRQRKKQKAEELEVDNKILRNQMTEMADELAKLRIRVQEDSHEKDRLQRENAQLQDVVNQSYSDRETELDNHTQETAMLRKKVQVLEEMVTKYESGNAVRASANNNYEFPMTHELSSLTVDALDMNQWDPFNDFLMNDDATETPTKMETSTLVLAPKKKPEEEKEDQSGPSGLLMLLLLCGAWVASKATTSMPVTIPRMPEEVRSDAAVVFDDLMKDHGVSTFQATGALESASSTAANVHQLSFPMHGSNPSSSRLDTIHSQLTRPSKRQEAESAFSLSVKQYEGLTSAEFADPPYSTPPEDDANSPSHRRHLVDTLKAMREETKGQISANVYTRSLLWERIPDDVLQQFKRMADQTSSRSASVDAE